jgi:hypothetical protein
MCGKKKEDFAAAQAKGLKVGATKVVIDDCRLVRGNCEQRGD